MTLPYKKILILGATSGIGLSMANRFISKYDVHVIAVGRRQDRLDEFTKKHGSNKASSIRFDISQLDEIPQFVQNVLKEHPDLDSALINSGIQRQIDYFATDPGKVDVEMIKEEFNVNYLAPVVLTKELLGPLKKKGGETALMYTTSSLALLQAPHVPNYCATKAALHSFLQSIRTQLESSGEKNLRIIDFLPPLVTTELHESNSHPQDTKTRESRDKRAMPVEDYTDAAFKGLLEGKSEIPVGMGVGIYDAVEGARMEIKRKREEQQQQQKK